MKFSAYKFKFYINANHAIYLGGVLGDNHPHTWEIILDTIKIRDDFVQFDMIEKKVDNYFSVFQDADINKIEPFTTINPTLENITEHFKNTISSILWENGWLLSVIEVSETPSRSYIIDMSDDADKIKEQIISSEDNPVQKQAKEIAKRLLSVK